MSGFGTERDQDRRKKRLKALLALPENKHCCECNQRQPQWASVNLGLFFCIRCSGIHRNLGVHISVVRSITLDSWKEEWVNMLEQVGNAKGLAYWEFLNAGNYKPANDQVPDQHLERFIRDKYIKGMWKNPDQSCAPHLAQPDDSKNGPQNNQTQSRPQSVKTQDNSPAPQQQSSFQQPQLQQQSSQASQASNTGLRKPTQTVGSINTSNSSNNHGSHGSSNPPTLSQVNSGIRLPTQPAPARAGMTSPLPQQYQGSTTAQSNQVVNVSKPKQQVDMDFESFFTDDSGSGNQSGNNQNPTQSVSTPMPTPSQQPLDILFGNGNSNTPMTPSGNANGSVLVQGSSVQNTPNPNDPFALLSQQSTNGGSAILPDKKDSILSLYDAPRSPQNNGQQFGGNMGMNNVYHHQQQQQQQQYQQQNGMISPQYGGYGGYGGNMGMVSPYQQYPQQQQQQQQQQGFNPYSQQQMNQNNSNAVFGNYNYSQPQQSGMNRVDQKQNNNTNNSHDVFAGLF